MYKGKHINDVLDMEVEEAVRFFEHIPSIYRKLKTLEAVWQQAEEIAELAAFLVSERSSYVTGQVVAAGGGRSLPGNRKVKRVPCPGVESTVIVPP